jgi:hypothetical protein
MFQRDADDIFNARKKSIQAHGEDDIRQAGDEFEIRVRDTLKERFAHSAYITHGHAIDSDWRVSNQLDFILTDPRLFPVWQTFESGSQHILYDAVHLVGEIKSSYRYDYLKSFCDTISELKETMHREKSTFSDKTGLAGGAGITIVGPNNDPFGNPLFTFFFAADSSKFNIAQLASLYEATPAHLLPNIVCLLDRGCIVHVAYASGSNKVRFSSVPEFDKDPTKLASYEGGPYSSVWALIEPGGDAQLKSGTNLAMLHTLMLGFLRRSYLKPSNVMQEIPKLFQPLFTTIAAAC